MVDNTYLRMLNVALLLFLCLLCLTGCPGTGDRMRFDETAQAYGNGDNICIRIIDAQDYQPVDMGINLRGTPSKEKHFDFSPTLAVVHGSLCIPPEYHHFTEGGKYIAEFILHSTKSINKSRSFVVGVGVDNNHVYNFPLNDREISRPYSSIEVSE